MTSPTYYTLQIIEANYVFKECIYNKNVQLETPLAHVYILSMCISCPYVYAAHVYETM